MSVAVLAQQTTETQNADGETVIELSPFEVSAEENIGYLANNTLAGTRLNTELKDVASAVQVLTKEFLDDVGASDLSELLTYTTGTEAAGVGGNASFGELNSGTERGERARREPQLNTRVRGLAAADLARDYFISDVAFDPYITSQVTINRGPNASLFGLGSPGGIINSTIDRAETGRTFGEINFKADEFGSWRASLNYNQMVVKDKLAIRIAALDSNLRYEQKNSKYDENRQFVAATWRPFGNLTIRANYETGDADGNRPKLRPPTDRITTWFANGKPSYNPHTNQWFKDGALVTDGAYVSQLNASSTQFGSQALNGNPAMIFDDPNSSIPGNNGYAVMQLGFRRDAAGNIRGVSIPASGHAYMRMFQGPRGLFARNPDYIVGARPDILPAERGFYSDVQITDLDIINIREYNLTGASSDFHRQNFEIYSVRAENTWLDNALGLEVAYQNQYWGSDLAEAQTASSSSTLNIDINTVLMDGSPNPNYGRPFIGGRGYAQAKIRERESFQAIGFGKYDFEDKNDGWLKHLGNHTLTAVMQSQENTETAPNRMNARASNDWNPSIARGGPGVDQALDFATNPRVQSLTRATMVQYLGPSLLGASNLQNQGIQGVTVPQTFQSTDNALLWNPFNAAFEPGSAQFFNASDDPQQVWTWGNPLNADEIESLSAVLQSQFVGGNIVTTASWRSDAVKQYIAAQASDPATGLTLPGDIPKGDPTFDEKIEQSSFGIVGHVPEQWLPEGFGLSAHFVDSQNIAAGTAGVDIFNVSAPLQSGTTKEYGFSVSALDSKFYARVNFFESAQNDVKITGTLPQIGNDITKVMENNTPAQLAAAGWDLYDGSTFDPGTIVALNIRPDNPGVPSNESTWSADNIAGTPTNYYQDTTSEGDFTEYCG